jgi:hypothetical protein
VLLSTPGGASSNQATWPLIYLQGIDNAEIIDIVHARRAPMIPASAALGS